MFSRKKILYFSIFSLLVLTLAACGPGAATQDPAAIYTQAAVTMSARMTMEAIQTMIVQQTQAVVEPSATPSPTATIPFTEAPTATQVPPTNTPVPPTNTPLPPTATPIPCNRAQFVNDVTVADGTKFVTQEYFTKTWRLKNVGGCTWDSSYDLVFANGDRMGGSAETGLNTQVRPGEVVDLSIMMRAPESAGNYQGFWQLRDGNGRLFGLGSDGSKPFWVKIEVVAKSQVVYSMVDNYCSATWSSNSGVLPCPGASTSSDTGYVVKTDKLQLESGVVDDEAGLYTRPDNSPTGFISGRYPAFLVQNGDRFRAVIGCGYSSMACDVDFEVLYSADGGAFTSLGRWRERNEGRFVKLDIDLSALKGRSVVFVLKVSNNGDSTDDTVSWLAPRIVR